ncbi:MAG: ATP-dependent helicase HrpB [Isosphaeraceae bacterium]
MVELPVDRVLPDLLDALKGHRAAVLVAPPGAGKTTRVPPAIVESGLIGDSRLILLQPRRIAARTSAARIAEERGWSLGEQVGYQVRFERRLGRRSRIVVQTEGILNRQILADPFLEGVGAVVLDEFHERSLHTDLAIALAQEVRRSVREDLVIVVMSATLDAAPIARFLGDCPVVRSEGRSFPVAIEHRPRADRDPLPLRMAAAIESALEAPQPGDLLAFLPGTGEIRRTARHLAERGRIGPALVLPLHGSLGPEEQDRALRPADRRKVILSTNVAETSLTIEGIGTVIDGGLARFARHDPARGLDSLELGRISRASADQRAGRAGRLGPGRCIRLWSTQEERGMAAQDTPEIARVDLAACLLAVVAWGSHPSRFEWFERPPQAAVSATWDLLDELGAIAGDRVTPLGLRLLDLPIHPRLGRLMIAAAERGWIREAAGIAAILESRDFPAETAGPEAGRSDLLARLDRLEHARSHDPALPGVIRIRDDLLRVARRGLGAGLENEPSEEDLLRLVLLAYPDRVARRREAGSPRALMVGGRGIRLAESSIVRDDEFFLALDPRDDGRGPESLVRIASAIDVDWLDPVTRNRRVEWDEARGRVVARDCWIYRDLVLREESHGAVDPDEAGRVLAGALSGRTGEFVRGQEAAAEWLDRLEFLRRALPEREWPALDEDAMAGIVADACRGRISMNEARAVPLVPLLQGLLTYEQLRELEAEAPSSLGVPTGNRIRVRYEPGRPPVLAVRLQELFGLPETPRLARGRVPVVLHLLGPNFRPVQITDDLRSFWATTYFQVRKDLRARYPRHSWPEDPLTARPESKGGRRQT